MARQKQIQNDLQRCSMSLFLIWSCWAFPRWMERSAWFPWAASCTRCRQTDCHRFPPGRLWHRRYTAWGLSPLESRLRFVIPVLAVLSLGSKTQSGMSPSSLLKTIWRSREDISWWKTMSPCHDTGVWVLSLLLLGLHLVTNQGQPSLHEGAGTFVHPPLRPDMVILEQGAPAEPAWCHKRFCQAGTQSNINPGW